MPVAYHVDTHTKKSFFFNMNERREFVEKIFNRIAKYLNNILR